MGNLIRHDIKVLRLVERTLDIRTQGVDHDRVLRFAYESALNNDQDGRVLSIEIDGMTYSVEEIRRMLHV